MYITKVYGGALVLVLVLNQGIWQTLQIAADYWLAYETSDANKASFNAHLFLFVYSSISFGSLLCALVRALIVAFVGVRTAQSFYLKMLQSIFRAPMSFFDTTPTGRIITRVGEAFPTLGCSLCLFWMQGLSLGGLNNLWGLLVNLHAKT
jgi:ABC-type multidrug transport system fused ATPase/permease subunit